MDSIFKPDQDQPSEVDRAVRAAAVAQPAPRLDISRVRSRARAHRQRRIAVPLATAVILSAAFITAVSVLRPTGMRGGLPQQTPTPAVAFVEDTQLYLNGMPARLLTTSEGDAVHIEEFFNLGGVAAVFDADGTGGTLKPVPSIPGLEGALETYSFGDGWLAGIGASKQPGEPIQRLIVMDGSGRVVVDRDIPLRGGGYSVPWLLAGSHATAIYQVLGERTTLVAFDLTTGAERDLWKATAIGGWMVRADATEKQVAVWAADPRNSWDPGNNCSVDVLDAITGDVVQQVRPAIADCARVDYKLAPDGVLLAGLVTQATSDRMIQRVVIFDIASGTIRKEVEVASWPIHRLDAPTGPELVAGIDWIDPTSLVYVRGAKPVAGREGKPPTVSAIRV